jgi:hypothetical protein
VAPVYRISELSIDLHGESQSFLTEGPEETWSKTPEDLELVAFNRLVFRRLPLSLDLRLVNVWRGQSLRRSASIGPASRSFLEVPHDPALNLKPRPSHQAREVGGAPAENSCSRPPTPLRNLQHQTGHSRAAKIEGEFARSQPSLCSEFVEKRVPRRKDQRQCLFLLTISSQATTSTMSRY